MPNIQLLSTWIGVIIALGTILWRIATLASDIRNNRKDINGLGKKVHDMQAEFKEASEVYDTKLQRAVDKLDSKVDSMNTEIMGITRALARIEGALNVTKEA